MRLIPSVTGMLDVDSMGRTLTHEHFFTDLTVWGCRPRSPEEEEFWNAEVTIERLGQLRRRSWSNGSNILMDDFDLSVKELAMFRDLGGRTMIDVTPQTVGRDPLRLRRLAEVTSVNLVCGTGFYVKDAHPPEVAGASVDQLADRMVSELMEEIDGTGIRAGIIGEIGTSDPLHQEELKVLHAAAAASRRTGAAITLHMAETNRLGNEVLDLFEADGVSPSHVIIGHSDGPAPDRDYFVSMLERGAFVQFDFFGATWRNDDLSEHLGYHFPPPSDDALIATEIAELIAAGHGDRLLLGQDICLKTQLVRYGGYGYGHVLRTILPQLRWLGVPEADVERLVTDNPRRAVAWVDPIE